MLNARSPPIDQLSQTVRWIHRTAVLVEGRGKAVNPNWHESASQKKIERSRMKAPIQSSMIGIKGLTFKASCDSSVAIAPAK